MLIGTIECCVTVSPKLRHNFGQIWAQIGISVQSISVDFVAQTFGFQ